jgi:hypothetical protein
MAVKKKATVKKKAKPAVKKKLAAATADILSGTYDDAGQTGTLVVVYQPSDTTSLIAPGETRKMDVTVSSNGGYLQVTLKE